MAETPDGSWHKDDVAPKKRAPRRKPVDADTPIEQKPAAQREAEAEESSDTITLEFHGEKFTIPADMDNDWPILARQAFGRAQNIDAVELLLGPEQWERYVGKFPRGRELNEFVRLISKEMGLGTTGN